MRRLAAMTVSANAIAPRGAPGHKCPRRTKEGRLMRKIGKTMSGFVALALLFAMLVAAMPAQADTADHVVISEVFYDESGADTNEFVELYNPTDAPVDISGWTLSHYNQVGSHQWTLTLPAGEEIPALGYYLIGQQSILDPSAGGGNWGYTIAVDALLPGSLQNGPNDYIVLEDDAASYVDGLRWGRSGSYATPLIPDTPTLADGAPDVSSGRSLERKPGYLDSGAGNGEDTDNNDQDFLSSAYPEPQNSASALEPNIVIADYVVINEVFYNPTAYMDEGEFVELYNPTDEYVDLSGWYIGDEETYGNTGELWAPIPCGTILVPGGYLIITNNAEAFEEQHGFSPALEMNLRLANGGDEVILSQSQSFGDIVDVVTYGYRGNFPGVIKHPGTSQGKSLERNPHGQDTDDCSADFDVLDDPTPVQSAMPTIESLIAGLPSAAFTNNNHQQTLLNKMSAVRDQIAGEDYQGAINKLENDVAKHVDDWISDDYAEKAIILSLIDCLVNQLEGML